jgi:hypothetical protein
MLDTRATRKLDIQSSITGESISNICEQCISLNKVEFKTKLGEIIVEHLRPIRPLHLLILTLIVAQISIKNKSCILL